MSNPTSNFGWQMPTSVDLVTDLPADFEVFGQAVDTDLADLNGGTTGQILSKTSATDLDFTWIDPSAGDITGVTAGTGISGGGTSGTVTVTNSMATAIDAKGDLIAGTGADTFSRLGIGANNTVLTADSAEATGLKWATPSGGLTFITSTTFTNSTGSNIDSIFSSSYENYLVVLDDLASVSGGAYVGMQFRYSSTTQTTEYYTVNFGYNTTNAIETNGKNAGATYVVARVQDSATARSSAQFFVSNVGNASEWATVRGQFSNGEGTHMGVFGGRVTAQTYTGIRLLPDPTVGSGSNISGRVTVYGLAKA